MCSIFTHLMIFLSPFLEHNENSILPTSILNKYKIIVSAYFANYNKSHLTFYLHFNGNANFHNI